MDEINIFLDKEEKKEVQDSIEFEPVMAGETTKQKIYIHNKTDYYMDLELGLEGKNIKISKTVKQIMAHQTEEVEFEFTPKVTLMKPIKAKLKIKINYIAK